MTAETEHQHQAGQHEEQSVDVVPEAEPSAAWGWHGGFAHGSTIAGWVTAGLMFLMPIGHSENHTHDVCLVAIGTGLVLLLIRHAVRARRLQR